MMFTDILRNISGVQVYPLVSLGLFVAFFTGVLAWALRADGRRLAQLAAIPLDEDDSHAGEASTTDVRETGRRTL